MADLHQPQPGVKLLQTFAVLYKNAQLMRAERHFAGRNIKMKDNEQEDDGGGDLRKPGDLQKSGYAVGHRADDHGALQHQVPAHTQGKKSARGRLPEIQARLALERDSV